jgi:hypothetical protein
MTIDFPWELLGETEIGQDDVPVCTDKDILGLEVTVDHTRGVQSFTSFDLVKNLIRLIGNKADKNVQSRRRRILHDPDQDDPISPVESRDLHRDGSP